MRSTGLAEIAAHVNERQENIGARRLHTGAERLLESLSFEAPDKRWRGRGRPPTSTANSATRCRIRTCRATSCESCRSLTYNVKALYRRRMIRSFGDEETRKLFETGRSKRFSDSPVLRCGWPSSMQRTCWTSARAAGQQAGSAEGRPQGDNAAFSINDQFRICFRWTPDGPEQVEIVDTTEDTLMYKNGMRPSILARCCARTTWCHWA